MYKLGITDNKGIPNPEMLLACKLLKIDLEDLEHKTIDDFLKKKHDEIYKNGGEKALNSVNLPQLAEAEFTFYQKRRHSKI